MPISFIRGWNVEMLYINGSASQRRVMRQHVQQHFLFTECAVFLTLKHSRLLFTVSWLSRGTWHRNKPAVLSAEL